MSEIVYEKFSTEHKTKAEKPVIVDWKDAKMIRVHSLRAAVKEMIIMAQSLDLVKVNIIGTPSTGKTVLSETVAHLVHTLADIPYTIKKFTRDDLLDLENTVKSLQPTNHVLIFDDVSFLSATAGKRQIDQIQKTLTEIRHLPGGKDVKIIAIFNFHYNMAISKYMRQSEFFFYTNIGSSELENTQKLVGVHNTQRILEFRKIYQQALTQNKYTFNLGKDGKKRFTYHYRIPFAPALFWNNDTLRFVVFPKREWVDPQCPDCANAGLVPIRENIDFVAFNDDVGPKFGKHEIGRAHV